MSRRAKSPRQISKVSPLNEYYLRNQGNGRRKTIPIRHISPRIGCWRKRRAPRAPQEAANFRHRYFAYFGAAMPTAGVLLGALLSLASKPVNFQSNAMRFRRRNSVFCETKSSFRQFAIRTQFDHDT
jgi:hypothetical protein